MMWGRTPKDSSPKGGATLPCRIFVRSMGLISFPAFVACFALADCKKTDRRQAKTHIYMSFVCTGGPSVRQCFVLYNVRAYSCVRLNVNSS